MGIGIWAPSTCNSLERQLNACEIEMAAAARRHGVPLGLLYAVALTETGQSGAPDPFTLNIDGVPVHSSSLHRTVEQFLAAKASGAKFIDVGCMQVDERYHATQFRSVYEMFEPFRNVDYAAKLLMSLRISTGSWTEAVARYHAGPGNPREQARYVCAVIKNMVTSGFGAWTNEARTFCKR